MILVMSKIDLKHEVVVTDNQAIDLAKKLNITFMKVSSKDNFMVNEVFEKLAIEHYKYVENCIYIRPMKVLGFKTPNKKINEISKVH